MVKTSVVGIKKNKHIVQILEEMYKSGQMTIATLAKKLHTSVPSITTFINELLYSEWIHEVGVSKTKSGRRPSLYDLNPAKKLILVIDINIHQTRFSILNIRNKMIENSILTVDVNDPALPFKILDHASILAEKHALWSVGISAPGLISMVDGINKTYPNHNIENKSIANFIYSKLDLPTSLSHDTQASLIGEHHYGLAKNKENVLLINLDWGIGLGILSNGHIVKGSKGFAGEMGHIQTNPNGELCHCGKKGCLETQASAAALLKKAKFALNNGGITTLSLIKREITLEDVIEAAVKGDEFCVDLVLEISRELGKGLSIAIHLFNPELIIIDGILSQAGELLKSTLIQSINKYCINDFKNELSIEISPMRDQAKVLGIKSLVFSNMLELGNF